MTDPTWDVTQKRKTLLAQVERDAQKAVVMRDRAHRLAKTLQGAATGLRMGDDPDVVALQLRKRGVNLGEETAA